MKSTPSEKNKKPLGITELMEIVGDENIEFQNLETCLIKAEANKKGGDITFGTGKDKVMNYLFNSRKFVGLVVWLPVEKLPEHIRPGK